MKVCKKPKLFISKSLFPPHLFCLCYVSSVIIGDGHPCHCTHVFYPLFYLLVSFDCFKGFLPRWSAELVVTSNLPISQGHYTTTTMPDSFFIFIYFLKSMSLSPDGMAVFPGVLLFHQSIKSLSKVLGIVPMSHEFLCSFQQSSLLLVETWFKEPLLHQFTCFLQFSDMFFWLHQAILLLEM